MKDKITYTVYAGYEAWLHANYEDLIIEAAETGADRELDFDFDEFCERKYFKE